jgi:hypothetical protein
MSSGAISADANTLVTLTGTSTAANALGPITGAGARPSTCMPGGCAMCMFSVPKPPPPPPLPPPPAPDAPAIRAAEAEARQRARLARGRASTILTGGTGLTEPAPIGRKRLLGD